jgi:ParB-like chromosome segregation protein Spo0J
MSTKNKENGKIEYDLEVVPIEKIKPYENNPRVHSNRSIEAISASIDAFGFKAPVVVD